MDQFIVTGVTSLKLGQKLKKNTNVKYKQQKALFAIPITCGSFHGPQVRVVPTVLVSSEGVELGGRMPPVQRRQRRRIETRR